MEIRLIRKGSKGLDGTYQNANHHAQPTLPLIDVFVRGIKEELDEVVKIWHQGHNIHVLESKDGRKIALRPFRNREGDWGIEMLVKISRSQEFPLFQILTQRDVFLAIDMIFNIFDTEPNYYQNQKGE